MSDVDNPQSFLFTFRSNGKQNEQLLVEVLVEQLADYDPSVAASALKSSWYGSEEALGPMLEGLGFEEFDVHGVLGALHDHRGADRRQSVTTEQLRAAGFADIS